MGVLKHAFVAVLVVVMAFLGAGSAAAQDDPPSEFDNAHAECMEKDAIGEGPFKSLTEKLPDEITDNVKKAWCMDATVSKNPGAAVDEAMSKFWDGKLAGIVREIKDGNPAVIGYTMSLWTKFKVDFDAIEMSANGINNIVWLLALGGLALSVVVGLLRVAASRRQGSGEALEGAAAGYGRYLLYGALVPAMAIPAIWALDEMADKIINTYVAEGGDFSKITDAATIGEEMNPILVLVFVLISLIGSLVMCLAIIMRIILLPVLIGLMPVFAAWAIGRSGKLSVENAMGVLVSFGLLKVVAALIYSAAVWAALSLDGSEESKLIAMVIFGATGLCAPALVTMVMPMMRGQAGGSAGAAGGALMGATGVAAGGAITAGAAVGGGALAAGGAAMSGAGSALSSAGGAMGLTGGNSNGSGGGSGSSGGGRGGASGGSGGGGGPSSGGGGGSSPSTGGSGSSGGGGGGGAHRGSGGGSGGPGVGGGAHELSKVGARIAKNSGAMAGSAMRGAGGILDDSVGAPAHPGRAYM